MGGNIMKACLIQFTYDHWCQRYEDATITVLVYVVSFNIATLKIAKETKYENARNFVNLTLE